MSNKSVSVAKATEEYMFGIDDQRNEELMKLVEPLYKQYSNREITNCTLVKESIKLTDNQNEKYYLAYQAGCFVEQQSNPFAGLFNAE